jgi:hypothetical protein
MDNLSGRLLAAAHFISLWARSEHNLVIGLHWRDGHAKWQEICTARCLAAGYDVASRRAAEAKPHAAVTQMPEIVLVM